MALFTGMKKFLRDRWEGLTLRLWAWRALGQVDKELQTLAIAALQNPPSGVPRPLTYPEQRAIHRRVYCLAQVASYHPVRPKCLHRSLALLQWLQSQGITAHLTVGWGDNLGHAWVVYGESILNDQPEIYRSTPPLERTPEC